MYRITNLYIVVCSQDPILQNFAKTTLGAERGSFYVVHKDKFDNIIADLYDEGLDTKISQLLKRKRPVKYAYTIIKLSERSSYLIIIYFCSLKTKIMTSIK